MNEKKSYKVHIFNEPYLLLSNESEAFVKKAADMVDVFMKEINAHAVAFDTKKVAVLAALRMADTVLAQERMYHEEQTKITNLINYINQELSATNM